MSEGRTAIQGTQAYVRQYVRRAYDYSFKRDVVVFYNFGRLDTGRPPHGLMDSTIARFFPDLRLDAKESVRKMIHRWIKMADKIIAAASTAKAGRVQRLRPIGVATVLTPGQEEIIVEWVVDLRRDGVPVSASMLRLKALEVAIAAGIPEGAFVASKQWRKGFLIRHRLSFRARTHQGQVSVADGEHAAAVFALQVRAVMAALGINEVLNADQTAVMFELLPKKTVSETGEKTVWVRCGGKDKERATAMLTANSDGTKLTLFLIFKAKPSTIAKVQAENDEKRRGFGRDVWKEVRELQAEHGIEIYGNRAGWWNEQIMIKYLGTLFGERHHKSPPLLLLLDHFSAHWTDAVKAYAASKNVVLMKIPAGLTWRAQPADVAWMKPFKDSLRRSWLEDLRTQIANKTPGVRFKMKAPTRKVVAAWATAAYASLSTSTIKNGFVKCEYVAGENYPEESMEEVVADDVLQQLVREGVVSYGAKDVVTEEMDVVDGSIDDDVEG